jgi:hypothetical protein
MTCENMTGKIIAVIILHFQFADCYVALHLNLHLQFSSTQAAEFPPLLKSCLQLLFIRKGGEGMGRKRG